MTEILTCLPARNAQAVISVFEARRPRAVLAAPGRYLAGRGYATPCPPAPNAGGRPGHTDVWLLDAPISPADGLDRPPAALQEGHGTGLRRVKELRQQCRRPNEMSITVRGTTPLDGNRRRCTRHRNHGHRLYENITRTRTPRPLLKRLYEPGIRQGLATTRHHRSPLECGAFRRTPPTR